MQIMVRASDTGRKSFLDLAQHIANTHSSPVQRVWLHGSRLGSQGRFLLPGSSSAQEVAFHRAGLMGGLLFGLCTETLLIHSSQTEVGGTCAKLCGGGAVV